MGKEDSREAPLLRPLGDPDAAKYLHQKDALHAGRTPRPENDGLLLLDLCNRFLTAGEQQRDVGDIAARTFTDYYTTCATLIASFGKHRLVKDLAADDFESLRAELAKARTPNTLGNEIQRIRVAFKYGYDAGLIDRVSCQPSDKKPVPESAPMRWWMQAMASALFAAAAVSVVCLWVRSHRTFDCCNIPLGFQRTLTLISYRGSATITITRITIPQIWCDTGRSHPVGT